MKWIRQPGKSYELITGEEKLIGEFTKCPKCLYDKARGSNFCPNCGADMRNEGKSVDYMEGYLQGLHDGNPFNALIDGLRECLNVVADAVKDNPEL